MSDSCIRAKPSMDEPSNPVPSYREPSSSRGVMARLFRNPSTGLVFVWYLDGVVLGASDYITQIDPSWEIVPRR